MRYGVCLVLWVLATIAATATLADDAIKHPRQKMSGTFGERQQGFASYYHPSLHGLHTSSGERYDKHALTGAHPNIPLGTVVKVTNQRNGRTVIVEINDRLPAFKRRIIDLSSAAAREIGLLVRGVAPVLIEVVGESVRGSDQ